MGFPMAKNLLKSGYKLKAFNRSQNKTERLKEFGAEISTSIKDAVSNSDIIITMLTDDEAVEKVMGSREFIENIRSYSTVIDMSSISPSATIDFAKQINDLGCDYLDAPVSGGALKAKTGELSIMVGGPRAAFDRANDVFNVMGGTVTLIGERNGDGQVCKVANQILVGTMTSGVAEALLFASKSGASPEMVRTALLAGAAQSIILENHGQRMIDRNFDPSFRADLQCKDLGLAVEACKEVGLYLPGATASWQLFNACIAGGDGSNDAISVLKTLEKMAGYELKK